MISISDHSDHRLESDVMASFKDRNVPADVNRTLRVQGALHGHSTEAEILGILETAVRSPDRVKLGSMLVVVGQEAGMTDEDGTLFDRVRDAAPGDPMSFD